MTGHEAHTQGTLLIIRGSPEPSGVVATQPQPVLMEMY